MTLAEGFVAANMRFAADESYGLQDASQYIADLAVSNFQSCDFAAVTLWRPGRRPVTTSTSDAIAHRIDAMQYALRQGPCLEAADSQEAVVIADLQACRNWPEFCAAVTAELPVRSVLAYPLADSPDRLALAMYSAHPGGFDGPQLLQEAALFVTHARGLILHARTSQRASDLAGGLAASRQIGTAVGVLMAMHQLTVGDAFEMLKQCSNRSKRKVRDIALDVIETGELPAR